MLVMSVGVREAARRLEIPEGTLCVWAKRGNWLKDCKPTAPKVDPPPTLKGEITVIKPADAMAEEMRENGEASRLALGRAIRKGSEHLASKVVKGETVVKDAQSLRHLAAAAGQIHGWNTDGNTTNIQVNLGLIMGQME